jgi:hypothetical protein
MLIILEHQLGLELSTKIDLQIHLPRINSIIITIKAICQVTVESALIPRTQHTNLKLLRDPAVVYQLGREERCKDLSLEIIIWAKKILKERKISMN